ncbi:hypothetical protein [Frondihabitans cladoniiphilus]|uniref:Uncharacterized protein n=1 Tax=Frondihabitans cladoniiphilus TaxID=715785 RepID=A0ABP8VUW6_9MICO
MDAGFFEDIIPRADAEAEFLRVLRDKAAAWQTDVEPADTWAETLDDPLAVGIRVRGLTGPITILWVTAFVDAGGPQGLEGVWGDSYVGESDAKFSPHELQVRGVRETPTFSARIAASWFEQQLLRPINRGDLADRWTSNWSATPKPQRRAWRSYVTSPRTPERRRGFAIDPSQKEPKS